MADAKQVDFLLSGYVNSSGNRLASGTATFTEPGSATLKDIWEDSNKDNKITNPAPLSETGTQSIYAEGEYDVIIKNPCHFLLISKRKHFI